MRLLTHTVTPQEAGLPVRTLLRRQLRISGSFLAKLKWRPGAITLNGIPVIVSVRTEAGDVPGTPSPPTCRTCPGTIPISGRWPGPWTSCGRMRTCWC